MKNWKRALAYDMLDAGKNIDEIQAEIKRVEEHKRFAAHLISNSNFVAGWPEWKKRAAAGIFAPIRPDDTVLRIKTYKTEDYKPSKINTDCITVDWGNGVRADLSKLMSM